MNEIDFAGSLQLGHNVRIGYFAQNQAATLDESLTVFQTIDDIAIGDIRTKIRDLLGAFMFGHEDIDKKVKVLSGGRTPTVGNDKTVIRAGKPAYTRRTDKSSRHENQRYPKTGFDRF
jgi:hypothetical protein